MLPFVPVIFDAYRTVRPALRWTLQNLVAFADRTGRCFPSVRKLAAVAGISKSTASRHLAELARDGILTRQRRPGGCYSYRVDSRFLPALRGVSHKRDRAVPLVRTEEHPTKKIFDSELVDDGERWRTRIRSFRKSGFWLPAWGARPTEPGCVAPFELVRQCYVSDVP